MVKSANLVTEDTDIEIFLRHYYDAFGNLAEGMYDVTNPFRYCGEYWDWSSGTYYLRSRIYDSMPIDAVNGRVIS